MAEQCMHVSEAFAVRRDEEEGTGPHAFAVALTGGGGGAAGAGSIRPSLAGRARGVSPASTDRGALAGGGGPCGRRRWRLFTPRSRSAAPGLAERRASWGGSTRPAVLMSLAVQAFAGAGPVGRDGQRSDHSVQRVSFGGGCAAPALRNRSATDTGWTGD